MLADLQTITANMQATISLDANQTIPVNDVGKLADHFNVAKFSQYGLHPVNVGALAKLLMRKQRQYTIS